MNKQASLPMYDFPEFRKASDAWWQGIARHLKQAGIDQVPERLLHDVPVKQLWQHPNLLLSQCCGFDVVYGLKDTLSVLLITDWEAEGCSTGHYSSWIVVHEDSPHQDITDLYGHTAVINGPESHSGMHSLFAKVQPYSMDGQFFKQVDISGAHVSSLDAIIERRADVAAIDCVTYALLKQYRPHALNGIRIIGQTDEAPAHPYVTSSAASPDTIIRMQSALEAAFNDADLDSARDAMLLKQGLFNRSNDYQSIVDNFVYDSRLLNAITHQD